MAVEHVFAPKDKPLGNLPANKPGTSVFPDASWSQFLRGEMPQTAGRNRIVDDGGHVWECELRASDTPRRNEAWRGDNAEGGVYFPGQTMGCVFGFKLDASWPVPSAWSVLWQIHTPYDYPTQAPSYASPMTLIAGDGGELRVQNNAEGGVDWRTPYDRGRWHYWIIEVLFGRPGRLKVWHALDRLPALSDVPVVDKSRNTSMPNHSTRTGEYTKSGIYVGSQQTFLMRRDGYAQASTAVRARDLYTPICRADALGTPPPPPGPTNRELVAAAKAELEQTTVSGKNWIAGGQKPGHWKNAYKLLDQIEDC